ncbi:unnamed protein product [Caenorhabditis nigoni]
MFILTSYLSIFHDHPIGGLPFTDFASCPSKCANDIALINTLHIHVTHTHVISNHLGQRPQHHRDPSFLISSIITSYSITISCSYYPILIHVMSTPVIPTKFPL